MSDLRRALLALPPNSKRMIAIAVLAGSLGIGSQVQQLSRNALKWQQRICAEVEAEKPKISKKNANIAVDKLFIQRLIKILKICVPSPLSKEAILLYGQGILLLSRTLLTDWISNVEGYCGKCVTSQRFDKFVHGLICFALVGIPAALVNSCMKYMQREIALSFQQRITRHLHEMYCSNRSYYAASVLGGLAGADQRLTEDIEKFSAAFSELFSYTFKPLLDVIMFTRSLSKMMGYRTQFILYVYYILIAWGLRAVSPPMASINAQEAALSGAFRSAHQRLANHSEEVAFNDPPAGTAELLILNQHLRRLVRFARLSALQYSVQRVFDGYFVKYFATVAALGMYALPIYLRPAHLRGSQAELTGDYIRSMRLLQNTNRGIGDLILIYKRVSGLASHTSRVAEIFEQIRLLSGEDAEHRELFRRNVSVTHLHGLVLEAAPGLDGGGGGSGADALSSASSSLSSSVITGPPPAARRIVGPVIRFFRVALDSPEGLPLVRELTFTVERGRSVLLMGQNGSGKSSLFRVLAQLWPLQAGEVTCPEPGKVFFLSQKPYLVNGSLRDQLMYPLPPRSVWEATGPKEQAVFERYAGGHFPPPTGPELDAILAACLRSVELEYLLYRNHGWDAIQNWNEVLSGGEKQRLAMARLLFHRPLFAVLDECTSAVSADGEVRLYSELRNAGITCLSIAHRPELRQFHSVVVHFTGNVGRNNCNGWIAKA
eukprot:CAMPEP_0175055446 /NCGR_PEP_ID=MMETSP0052_2-20121109/10083_1 /TAXON_ID=51329 ORGANISM="Polytomella parva, Strain SAG 63-3" /NCGR_SAMPLE_ID=MMETSP0052_2 /ASSEMBLY_ACC=CAM_ASM_000194 /LENGTH=716 /DNA_ID=CAMNT_0016320289 /DNA_START=42 /DNA_END=2189 /DNA_ORIENTATION=-